MVRGCGSNLCANSAGVHLNPLISNLQEGHRAYCIRELYIHARHRGSGLLPDKQVLRGTARRQILWRKRQH